MSGKRHVMPGEVITTAPLKASENTLLAGKSIVATAVGISDIYEDTVRVIPLSGKYTPRIDDLVVGKVISHTSSAWELDINSYYVGFLPATDVFGRDFASHADELTSKLKKGDLVAVRIANFDRTRDPLVTVGDRDLGKIDSGVMVVISPGTIPRLIGKKGSMIQAIENQTGAEVTIGQNGWVVIACESGEGLELAKRAVLMLDEKGATPNMADRVRGMLEQKGRGGSGGGS